MKLFLFPILTILLTFWARPCDAVQTDHTFSRSISVHSHGEVHVPADIIYFHVNITRFSSDARESFQQHKEQEAFLTSLLIEEGIEEKNITANPINISPTRRSGEVSGYETRQQVQLKLDDATQFEAMQIALIENGFVNFSGNFSSTKIPEAQNEALKNAVMEAKRKADLLAGASGLQITEVITIDYGSSGNYTPMLRGVSMAYEADSGSLLQFEHSIPVREHVRIVYRIGER